MRRAPEIGSNRNVVRMSTDTDEADKKSADPISVDMTDLEVPKFDSSDFEETKTSPGFDWFTPVLIAYVVFVIADIAFHITPDKPYIEVLRDALSSGGGEDAAST
jgi:hypothetical protein